MGAEFITEAVTANDELELKNKYAAIVERDQYNNGHSGYTGSFAESPGLTISGVAVPTEEEAEDYIYDNCRKWENTIAVRIEGSSVWILGGLFSS